MMGACQFQYKLNKEYRMDPEQVVMCKKGFHACDNPWDVFHYFQEGRMFECEGVVVARSNRKVVCSSLKLIKEVNRGEVILDVFRKNSLDQACSKLGMTIDRVLKLRDIPEELVTWGIIYSLKKSQQASVALYSKSRHVQRYLAQNGRYEILKDLSKNRWLHRGAMQVWPTEHKWMLVGRREVSYKTKLKYIANATEPLVETAALTIRALRTSSDVPVLHFNRLKIEDWRLGAITGVIQNANEIGVYPKKLIWSAYEKAMGNNGSLYDMAMSSFKEDLLKKAWDAGDEAVRTRLIENNHLMKEIITRRRFDDIYRP